MSITQILAEISVSADDVASAALNSERINALESSNLVMALAESEI